MKDSENEEKFKDNLYKHINIFPNCQPSDP